jgi:hypothetical protein
MRRRAHLVILLSKGHDFFVLLGRGLRAAALLLQVRHLTVAVGGAGACCQKVAFLGDARQPDRKPFSLAILEMEVKGLY